MNQVRRAKIVATLGPATDGLEHDLVAAGVDVVRLNFSHGASEEHRRRCTAIRTAAKELGRSVAVMQDLQGPKIRIGRLVDGGPVQLEAGQTVTITTRDILGTATYLSTTYAGLPTDVKRGDRLLLDDGRLRLAVRSISDDEVVTEVEEGGLLGEHKGINLPGIVVSAPALTPKDRDNMAFGVAELAVDYIALSFVRSAEEVREARQEIQRLGGHTPLIVKLEKGEAINDLDAIITVADGVMVARGDLGVELGPEKVPALQKKIIARANLHGIPVITATQMLESMVSGEVPTRAEANDVANAVWDGSDAVMLSAETAVGRHPLLVVRMMDRIIREAEATPLHRHTPRRIQGLAASVTQAACVLAEGVKASAIIGFTHSGRTAQLLSGGRPGVCIYAFSPDERVCSNLALWWGVTPVHHPMAEGLELNIAAMEGHLLKHNCATPGDTTVIVGSHPFKKRMHTNFVKYQVLRELHDHGEGDEEAAESTT